MDRARGAFCAARSRGCVGRGIACVLPHLAEGLQPDLSQWTGNLHRRVRWALSDLFVVRVLSVQRSRSTLPGQHKGPDRDREGQEGDRCGPPHWMRPELRRKALRLESAFRFKRIGMRYRFLALVAFSAANRRPAPIKSGPGFRRKMLRRRSRETLIAFWVPAPFRVTCLIWGIAAAGALSR